VEIAQRIEALRALPPERLLQGVNSWLPTATAIVLVPVIAWYGAGLIWALLPGQPSYDWTRKAPATAMPVAAPRQTAAVDFGAIAAAHLFGEADAEPPPQTAVTAPDTRLNLKLRGTIAADDETIAHAIIVDGNSKANVYFIEDAIPGGASLHEVYPDRVILKRGGAFETLRLPKESQGAARQTTAPFPGPPASTMGASARSPASNSSLAAFTAFTAPIALRSIHGTCTSPPTGSQVRPRLCSMPISAALATCSAVPPQSAASPPAAIEQATPTSP